jgi:hypothetical protein
VIPVNATDERRRLQDTLELYASQAERLKPVAFMLIDATEFLLSVGDPGVMTWRDEQIIPRYTAQLDRGVARRS